MKRCLLGGTPWFSFCHIGTKLHSCIATGRRPLAESTKRNPCSVLPPLLGGAGIPPGRTSSIASAAAGGVYNAITSLSFFQGDLQIGRRYYSMNFVGAKDYSLQLLQLLFGICWHIKKHTTSFLPQTHIATQPHTHIAT